MNITVSTVRRLVALALLGALAVTAVALLHDPSSTVAADEAPAGQPGNPYTPRQTPAEHEAAFAANFALLRAPADDAVPATLPAVDPTLQLDESRALTPPPARALARGGTTDASTPEEPDTDVWVAPKDDGSQCLLVYLPTDQTLGSTCAFPVQAVAGQFLITMSRTGTDAEIYGLMPDGVDTVTVTLADGSDATLPVVENAYMAQFDQPTVSLSWTDADGVEHTLPAGSGGG